MKRSLFLSIMLLPFLLAATAAGQRGLAVTLNEMTHAGGKLGAYRALIIGINDYADNNISDLKTAVNDAREMDRVLKERYGFQTQILLDRQASRRAIIASLRDLAGNVKPEDSVLIYYAGHGEIDPLLGGGWWVPADARGGDPSTYLENTMVQAVMAGMRARHVLLVSDSCYSGTLFGDTRSLPPLIDDRYYQAMYNEKSRWGMTSGNKTPVSDQGTGGHSVFAYQLLKELRGNTKPFLSTQELYTRIAPIIGNNSEQAPLCRPIRNTGDQGGNFVFVAARGASSGPSMPVIDLPAAPPVSSGLPDMDAVIREREASQQQWAGWLKKMEADYEKARSYDNSDTLTTAEKAGVWSQFLAAWGSDNRYSSRDEEMRAHARSRQNHWASVKPAPSRPAAASSGGSSQVVQQDGTWVAYANGVVHDRNTGLEWLAGPDKVMDWNEAKAWVESLSVGGGGWRMPTLSELRTLYKKGAGMRNMSSLFKTTGWYVWSGETRGSSSAWHFPFSLGNESWLLRDFRSYGNRAFAVRSRG